jgi:hypothetical protein
VRSVRAARYHDTTVTMLHGYGNSEGIPGIIQYTFGELWAGRDILGSSESNGRGLDRNQL